MQIGISHYPEYYPRERWDRHFEMLASVGLKRIRFGESSWASFQPARHEFRWNVLDDAIKKAAEFGIEVVLGIPTYVPPLWLVKQHPGILPVGVDGRRTVFGARQHRCFNTPAYIEAADTISDAMVRRYGKHPNVVAWQIDNELGGEQKRCYCENCRRAFQSYLCDKYGGIEELNRRWNTVFWGQQYDSFEDIGTPVRFNADLEMRHHPALELEFARFSSESIVLFCERQYDILRPHTDRPITQNTDSFYWGDNVNIHRLFRKLDVAGMDLYSDRPFEIGFYSDLTRSVSKGNRFWMTEYGTRSPQITAEFEIARQRGCEWLLLFKMLPFPWGQEIDRKALFTLSGNPEPNCHAVRNWCTEHSEKGAEVSYAPRVGLFYDFDSSWAYSVDQWRQSIPITERQVYPLYIVEVVYRAIFEAGLGVEILFEPTSLGRFEYIIDARHLIHDPETENALINYVAGGGKLIVTSDLFRRNTDNAWLEYVPEIYRKLFGWHNPDFPDDALPPQNFQILEGGIGCGQAWMLHHQAALATWQSLLPEGGDCFFCDTTDVLRRTGEYCEEPLVFDQRGTPPKSVDAF